MGVLCIMRGYCVYHNVEARFLCILRGLVYINLLSILRGYDVQ